MIINLVVFITRHENLTGNGGWGILALLALFFIGIIGFGIDFILQRIIKDKITLNALGFIFALIFFFWIWPQL